MTIRTQTANRRNWRRIDLVVRAALLKPWMDAPLVLALQASVRYCVACGVTATVVQDAPAHGTPRSWPEGVAHRVRGGFCRAVLGRLRQAVLYDPERRMRHKLEQWRLPGPPQMALRTALRELRCLLSGVPCGQRRQMHCHV